MKKRCGWVNLKNDKYIDYHDTEWWKPVYDDTKLFEMLILEWAQAGLSWETVLNKRENYREAFFDYDLEKIQNIDAKYFEVLQENSWIIRNKLKIKSVVQNANTFREIQKEFGSFSKYIWSWTDEKTIVNDVENYYEAPVKTELSEKISKDLKKRGMNFVGPTIIYAYLQAIWVIDDHENNCFCKNP